MRRSMSSLWWRDSNQTASGNPGAVQDQYLRWLLVAGAMSVIRQAKRRGTNIPWLADLIARKPTKVAAVALANKTARIAWVLLSHDVTYRKPTPVAG